jgi:hypothetical protein
MARQFKPVSEKEERRRRSNRELFRSCRNDEEWRQLLREFVLDHCVDRLDVLGRFLVIVEELCKHKVLGSKTRVSQQGAVGQDFKGSGGFIATHLMHCQILVSVPCSQAGCKVHRCMTAHYKTPDLLVPCPAYAEEVKDLFWACTDQPPWVNIADIVLEANGARDYLVQATEGVLRGNPLVAVFTFFLSRYAALVDRCIDKKQLLADIPFEEILARGELESVPYSLSDRLRDERVKMVLEFMKACLPDAADITRSWFPQATAYRQQMISENWFTGPATRK